jgi:diketogulonate reductase-like aldo/keto reductase
LLNNISEAIKIHHKMEYPQINFGTYRLGGKTFNSLNYALENNYRGIDTASLYQCEPIIGEYIGKNQINRSELFITSKLNPKTYSRGVPVMMESVRKTLSDLGTDYIDLFLIHKPDEKYIKDCWFVLEEFYKQGIFKNIGVSNFDIHHMEIIREYSTIPIYTNQIELSPFLKRPNVVKYMNEHGIKVSAHSSLAKGEKFDDATVNSIASKYGKTPAQIMLKWGLQNGYNVIPRSSNKEHIVEDISLDTFHISKEDMSELNNISVTHITHPQYILS